MGCWFFVLHAGRMLHLRQFAVREAENLEKEKKEKAACTEPSNLTWNIGELHQKFGPKYCRSKYVSSTWLLVKAVKFRKVQITCWQLRVLFAGPCRLGSPNFCILKTLKVIFHSCDVFIAEVLRMGCLISFLISTCLNKISQFQLQWDAWTIWKGLKLAVAVVC